MTDPIEVTEEVFDAVGVPFAVMAVGHLLRCQIQDVDVTSEHLDPIATWAPDIRERYVEAVTADLEAIRDWAAIVLDVFAAVDGDS